MVMDSGNRRVGIRLLLKNDQSHFRENTMRALVTFLHGHRGKDNLLKSLNVQTVKNLHSIDKRVKNFKFVGYEFHYFKLHVKEKFFVLFLQYEGVLIYTFIYCHQPSIFQNGEHDDQLR